MSAAAIKTLKLGKLVRSFALNRAGIDTEKRTVRVQFSSEEPVQRWFGEEILDHAQGSVDLSRANAGCAVLLEHDTYQRIGITSSAEITGNKTGEAVIRFSKSAKGEEAFQEVQDGTLRWVSVGYRINRMKQEGDVDPENPEDLAVYRATSWEPMEISLVAIPADTTARVLGRGENNDEREITIENFNQRKNMPENTPAPAAPVAPVAQTPVVAPAIVRSEADVQKDFQARAKEIMAIGNEFKRTKEASDAVIAGKTVEQFRKEVMDAIKSTPETEDVSATRTANSSKTPGEILVGSESYRNFLNGKGTTRSASVELPDWNVRATGTTSGLTSIQKQDGIVLLEQQPLRLADVIPSTTTDALTIRYISENSFTNAATALAEEGTYAEASWDLVETDATVRKIGVIGRVTDEFFADFGATRDYVNNRLRFMVESKEDNHLLNGSGNTNQIKGLLNFSGIQTQAQAGDSAPDAIHKAITKVRAVGFFEPDAIVMHPTDYQGIRLMKDANSQYFGGGIFGYAYGQNASAAMTLWGLPVVQTTAITSGTCLVGAFRLGAQIFRKAGLMVESTNSDASDFANGRVAIRADVRLTIACFRPLAFCSVTGLQ
jgi:HK97 family phage major capsid protein/HK97 family phage prohead protease